MDLFTFISLAVTLLVSLTLHELAHGLVAYNLGDPTAKHHGRLSLNPLRHLDVLGTIVFFVTSTSGSAIGWAKPVPVDNRHFRNPKIGMAMTALAGPLVNFLLAMIAVFPFKIAAQANITWLADFLSLFVHANLFLGLFNLLPLPPLDGSKVLGFFVPVKYERGYYNYLYVGAKYFIAIILFDVFILGNLVGYSFLGDFVGFLERGLYIFLAMGT